MKQHDDKETVNPLCRRCVRPCRQPAAVTLCECRRFVPYPFKIEAAPSEQMGLFVDENDEE